MAASPSTAADLSRGEPRVRGLLELAGHAVAVEVAVASRLSLSLVFEGAPRVDVAGAGPAALVLELGGRTVRLGPCRVLAGPGSRPARLVFTEHVYDCEALVAEGRVVELRGSFENLPVVLGQKEHIRPEFRDHVASVAYDLSVHKRFFDEQERVIAGEPEEVAATARAAIIRAEGRQFLRYLDRRIEELNRLVAGYSREEHERHGFYLRRQLWPYLLASEFMKRTNLKPAGYAGDAELMLMIYENAWVGRTIFDQLMHKHGVETTAAEAVRSRRRLVPRLLREVLGRTPELGPRGFRLMSLACGPAAELEDVFQAPADLARLDVTLLDQDPQALELARAGVRRIEARLGGGMAVRYLQDSVRTMLRSRDLSGRFGRFHFVYSMGLFDYLSTPVARAVLAKTYELLAPGGVLLVGNFHVGSPTRLHMDYWGDWPLTYRTEPGFLALADGLPVASRDITFDETRCQMFLRLEKPWDG